MASIKPKLPRWKRDGTQFIIPSYRGLSVILFLALFVFTWGAGLAKSIRTLIHRGLSEEFAWAQVLGLLGVLFLTALVAVVLAWHVVGREVVEVVAGELVLAFEVLGLRHSKKYSVSNISALRSVAVPPWGFRAGSRSPIGSSAGAVAFDYGARTIRFGASLDEAEAKLLVKELVLHTPSLGRDL